MSQNYPMHARKVKKCRAMFCDDTWVGSVGIAVFLVRNARATLDTHPETSLERGALFFLKKKKAAHSSQVSSLGLGPQQTFATHVSEDVSATRGTMHCSALAEHDRMFFSCFSCFAKRTKISV